ncbi:MAG TPA: cystathionine gamma-synthase family protein [Gemmatimonadales bacterium]|nr:cystathionine gamma-synthase family protein [Gemmatimonadales bacterium]
MPRRKRISETFTRLKQAFHPESLMMTYGYKPEWSEGALKVPIFQTSTFVFQTAEEGKAFFEIAYGLRQRTAAEPAGLIYSRINNPDLEILEERLALWDGAESCAVFNTGMAAIATTLMAYVRPGDVVLYSTPLYGGTDHLLKHVLPGFGVTPVPFRADACAGPDDIARNLARAQARGRVSLLLVETPANPTNALVDLAACAEFARRQGNGGQRPLVLVDNTFLGPLWQQPLRHGADIVLYSATKYIGGHSDLLAGAALGSHAVLDPVRVLRTFFGTLADPWTGWLLMRSLETLKLRMTSAMKNARYVADFLASHAKVARVYYLGHLKEGDPQYAVYRRQCTAPGAMVSFEVRGGEAEAFRFLNALKLVKLAVSLGGTESLAEHPFSMTHADVSPEAKREAGVTEGMIRLSVGIEHPDDTIADLDQALATV